MNVNIRVSCMRLLRSLTVCAAALVFVLAFVLNAARAESDKIRVGKAVGGSGFHIPSYLAMDKGFYKAEGLDAQFVVLQARALVTAANMPRATIPTEFTRARPTEPSSASLTLS